MSTPTLPLLELSEDEHQTVQAMTSEVQERRFWLEVRDAYYRGEARIQDLGISVPPQLRGLHTVIGWPRIAVDALEERLDVEGFRYPGATDTDDDLWEIWQSNNLDEEAPLAHLDALVFGHAYIAAGSGACGPNKPDCPPLITVESPQDMTVNYDPRTRTISEALRLFDPYPLYGDAALAKGATLYLPETTLSLVQDTNGHWELVDRDDHQLGVVPVVRMSNRQRISDRVGRSEITAEIMSITDAACRTLLGLEVAREFYSGPQKYIIGASEGDFQDAEGNPKTAWETYLGRVLALERDEEGNLPTVGQFAAYDPSVFTKVLDAYSKIMSSLTGLPPHYLGDTTVNPASADAIRAAEARLVKRVQRKQQAFSGPWEDALRLALLIRDGDFPDEARRLTTVWAEPGTPTIAEVSDAITKQIQVGAIPATSDVTLERLGYDPTERERLDADRQQDIGAQILAELSKSLVAKEARVSGRIADKINPEAAKDSPVINPATGDLESAQAAKAKNAPPPRKS